MPDIDRVSGGIFRRLQRPLDRMYQARHPGRVARALIGAMAPAVRRMVPNDKWSLGVHAPYWMRAASAAPLLPVPAPRCIFQFCTYRGQFTLELSLAALLAWRGHQVTIGYLPRLGSPIKVPLYDDPSAAPYLAEALSSVERASGGRVRIVDLTSCLSNEVAIDRDFVEAQAYSDTMMHTGRETLREGDPVIAEALRYYRDLGNKTQTIARSFFATHAKEFDLALIANAMTFEGAHMAQVAQQFGVELVSHEKFAFRKIRIFTHGDTIFSFRDLNTLWERRAELGFDAEPFRSTATQKSQELLNERRYASVKNWAWKYQFAPEQSDEATLAAVGLKPEEKFILVCTNVPYDAGFMKLTTIFPTMRDWLIETVKFLADKTDLPIVIRIHPGEVLHYAGREKSIDNLAAAGVLAHPRVKVIGADEKINTYPLMQRCHAGVVFSSTTGLEMAMLGRPVVVGSKIYYADAGFTRTADDRDGYFRVLESSVREEIAVERSRKIATDAQLYYYLLHFVLQQPYPYDKGADLRRLPPHRLVSGAEIARYVKTLDILTTPPSDFEAELDRFFGVRPAAAKPDAAREQPKQAVNA
jgi:hypothetical protein